jgi:hypothetical protein
MLERDRFQPFVYRKKGDVRAVKNWGRPAFSGLWVWIFTRWFYFCAFPGFP